MILPYSKREANPMETALPALSALLLKAVRQAPRREEGGGGMTATCFFRDLLGQRIFRA
jgi:hypothetical protein